MPITDDIIRLELFATGPWQGLTTPAEFAELVGVDESAIRHAIKSGKLKEGVDCMKFGKQWVLSPHAFTAYQPKQGYTRYYEIMNAYENHPERGHGNVNNSADKAGD